MSSAAYRMHLLGAPSLAGGSGELIKLRTRKQFALLARLAWEAPRPLSRDYLIDLFWPAAEPKAARHSLAQALSALRAALGAGALITRGKAVALAAGVVSVDLRAPDLNGPACLGEVFEGFELSDAPAFEQWRDQLTALTWPVVRDAVVRAIAQAKAVGRYREVEELGLQLIARDPLCEAGVEARMQGRALAGDRIGALAVFDEYAGRLRAEVGVDPGYELTRAAENLRRGILPRSERTLEVETSRSGGREVFKPVPLVGREDAYRELHAHWVRSRGGEPRAVVIVGAPGVGKTVLAMTLAAAAHAEGAAVARVQLHDSERTAPYGLLSELVRQVIRYPGAAATAGEALAELSRTCPTVRVAFPGVAEAPPAMPETVYLRLTEALLALLDAVVEEQPVMLVVDDLHLADDASLIVLERVSRRLESRAVMVCATAHDVQSWGILSSTQGNRGEVTAWYWQQHLGPLEERAARALVRERLVDVGDEERREVEDRVLRQARGNPLALEMLVLDWRTHGAESLVFLADALTGSNVTPSRIPETIRGAVERQRVLLSEAARETLDLAAVLGHRLLDLEIYEALGASPLRVAEASRQLLAAGIWTDVGPQLDFRNELVRTHAYFSIPHPTRVVLHRRVARVLERRKRDAPDPRLWLELAWHYWRADAHDEAVFHSMEGAEQCLRTFAPRTAERVATDCLAESITEGERSRFRYVLGRALAMQSRLREAEEVLRGASRDHRLDARQRVEARVLLGELLVKHISAACSANALDEMASALPECRELNDAALQARAYGVLCRSLIDLGREDELPSVAQKLTELAHTGGCAASHCDLAVGFLRAHYGQLEAAKYHLERAAHGFRSDGNWEALAESCNGLGVTLHGLGQWERARDAFLEAHNWYQRVGDVQRCAKMLSNVAAIDICGAKYDLAATTLCKTDELLVQSEPTRHAAVIEINRLQAALGCRDFALATECYSRLDSMVGPDSHWEVQLAADLARADYHLVMEHWSRAWELVARGSELAKNREHLILEPGQFLRLETARLANRGDAATALRWVRQAGRRSLRSRTITRLTFHALVAWLEVSLGVAAPARFVEAVDRILAAGALGLVDELAWTGIQRDRIPATLGAELPGASVRVTGRTRRVRRKPTVDRRQ